MLDKPLTVKENLKSRAALYGITGQAFEKRLQELLDILDFGDYLNRPVGKLSGGQRRRIDIARALLHRPEILILDEPTTGLDPQTRQVIWNVIEKLRIEEQMTVFLTTHYMEEAANAAYVVILDKGSIVAEGTPYELKNRYVQDTISVYGVTEAKIKSLHYNYKKVRDGYQIKVDNTSEATKLIVEHQELFQDYEVVIREERNIPLSRKKSFLFLLIRAVIVLIRAHLLRFCLSLQEKHHPYRLLQPHNPETIPDAPRSVSLPLTYYLLLSVSCITVTFCVNLTMVQDLANGARKDFNVSPVKKSVIFLGYFLSTLLNSLMVNGLALVVCLIYMCKMGWYMSVTDVLWVILDEILLVLFGCALSSIICYPLKTQGQMSAVGTIVSAGYGFICGAYMPISNFDTGLQKVLSVLPGTYGTSLLKNHMLRGIFEEMSANGFPEEVVTAIGDSLDCNPVFGGHVVSIDQMIFIMMTSIVILGILYLVIVNNCEAHRNLN